MYQKCKVCSGEVKYGFCTSCALPAEDYRWDDDAEETEER